MTTPPGARPPSSNLKRLRPVTLKMVAKAAQVSEAAVSYVLRGRAREMSISTACEARVRKAAARLGYQGNYYARSLALQSSTSIGMAVGASPLSFIYSPYFSSLVAGCEMQIRNRGYDLHIIGSPKPDEALKQAYEQMVSRRVEGLIIFPFLHLFEKIPKQLLQPGLPVVFVEGLVSGTVATIALDADPGIAEAAEHLRMLGHRKVAWIGMRGEGTAIMGERLLRYRKETRSRGMQLEEVLLKGMTGGEDVSLREMLSHIYRVLTSEARFSSGTTAILCENDTFALALLKVLSDRGIRVPQDMSVVGFDDIYSLMSLPSITTISHRLMDIGTGAVDMVLDIIAGKAGRKPARTLVPATLMVRESTGPART
jgi:LacI family transcriptional regulator